MGGVKALSQEVGEIVYLILDLEVNRLITDRSPIVRVLAVIVK